MTPYADLLFLGLALCWVLPAIVLGLAGRLTWHWVLASTLVMGVLQMAIPAVIHGRSGGAPVAAAAAWVLWQWIVARAFLRWRSASRRWLVWPAVASALLPLAAFKYVPWPVPVQIIGISYVTFRAVDVVLGIHDGLVKALPAPAYLTYVIFFPTLSAGPIDRYQRFIKDFGRRWTGAEYLVLLDEAVHPFFMGVLCKFVVAVAIGRWWLDPVSAEHGWRATVSYMYAYSFYLFFDFAGYSAFAVSFSKLFGIRTPENFNQPWRARDLADFWGRWHISLSTWLRDQVYMRFVMKARAMGWFGSRKYAASAAGLLLSFGVMGLWHGAAPRYIVYGLLHGTLLIGLETWRRHAPARPAARPGPVGRWTLRDLGATLFTLQVVCVSFLIFSGRLF